MISSQVFSLRTVCLLYYDSVAVILMEEEFLIEIGINGILRESIQKLWNSVVHQ